MIIPTEPIGSIFRPPQRLAAAGQGARADTAPDALHEAAACDSVARLEASGSPVITDGTAVRAIFKERA